MFTFAAPRILLNGQEVSNDYGHENSTLSFQNASGVSGDIYYTLDGSDPRLSQSERLEAVTKTLVAENAPKRVLVPTANIGTLWRSQIFYNDTSWNDGLPVDNTKAGGVGYENNPGESTSNVPYISYNIGSKMYNNYTSAYVRIPFTVDPAQRLTWNYLTLKMRYDDGLLAYINGVESAAAELSAEIVMEFDCFLTENSSLETFVISNYLAHFSRTKHSCYSGDERTQKTAPTS